MSGRTGDPMDFQRDSSCREWAQLTVYTPAAWRALRSATPLPPDTAAVVVLGETIASSNQSSPCLTGHAPPGTVLLPTGRCTDTT